MGGYVNIKYSLFFQFEEKLVMLENQKDAKKLFWVFMYLLIVFFLLLLCWCQLSDSFIASLFFFVISICACVLPETANEK